MPKKKNPSRYAPVPFESTLKLVSFAHRGNSNAFGHLVQDDGTYSTILPEMERDTILIPSTSRREVLCEIPDIPVGAYMTVLGKRPDRETYPEFDFFIFESHVPRIYIRLSKTQASDYCYTGTDSPAAATVATIDELAGGDDTLRPWNEFFLGCQGHETVWRIDVLASSSLPVRAGQLLKLGFIVACCGVPANFVRVKGAQLKWATDDTCALAMSTITDTMPGLMPTRWPDVYTDDFQIQRPMLYWGMFAGCHLNFRETEAGVEDASAVDAPGFSISSAAVNLSEPLQSYVNALSAVKSHRRLTGRIDTFIATDVCSALKYNTCQPLSSAQQKQALAIFYWASVHSGGGKDDNHASASGSGDGDGDADSAAAKVPLRQYYKHALNMYLIMFGYVLLRKRAYEFHVSEKRKRVAAHRVPAYMPE